MVKRVLITGATGFIGGNLVKANLANPNAFINAWCMAVGLVIIWISSSRAA